MWEVVDPDGRNVLLTWTRWMHILRRHPYIGLGPDGVAGVVARPDTRLPGHRTQEE